jgi:hypothetical protein
MQDKTTWELAKEHFNCEHLNFEIRSLMLESGGFQYKKQCLDCGQVFSQAIRHAAVLNKDKIKPIDEALKEKYYDSIRTQSADIRQMRRAYAEYSDIAHSAEWHKAHAEYLQSPLWQSKRELILRRDNYTCQRCQSATATDVHHITYHNLGNEYNFELVSVCRRCHDIIHGRTADE